MRFAYLTVQPFGFILIGQYHVQTTHGCLALLLVHCAAAVPGYIAIVNFIIPLYKALMI
jgi:hypothetical protein